MDLVEERRAAAKQGVAAAAEQRRRAAAAAELLVQLHRHRSAAQQPINGLSQVRPAFWRGGTQPTPTRQAATILREGRRCARRVPPRHLGGRPEQGHGLRCARIYRETRTGLPERREHTPRAKSPYIRGMRRSGPHEVLGGILVCVLGYFGPSPHGGPASHVPIRVLGRSVLVPPGMAARARGRKVLRPDRPPKANARSPPGQLACFSSPAPKWLLGSRTAVLLALVQTWVSALIYLSIYLSIS